MDRAASHWIGFRVDIPPPNEPILTDVIAPWLQKQRDEHMLLRWFYLWYSESGHHLRLRIHATREQNPARLAHELNIVLRSADPRITLHSNPYDRAKLAFGETRESVLAELLHVATSDLALRLLGQIEEDTSLTRRWAMTAALAAVLVTGATAECDLDQALADWCIFAAHAARRMTPTTLEPLSERARRARLAALEVLASRLGTVVAQDTVGLRAIALLRRARQRGELGRFVAIHALHLFCNEMGFGFDHEQGIVASIQTWSRARRMPTELTRMISDVAQT